MDDACGSDGMCACPLRRPGAEVTYTSQAVRSADGPGGMAGAVLRAFRSLLAESVAGEEIPTIPRIRWP